jgi:hypothetical protein
MDCKKELETIYQNLQALDINPTRKNLTILLNALDGLKWVYNALGGTMKDMEEKTDVQADTE